MKQNLVLLFCIGIAFGQRSIVFPTNYRDFQAISESEGYGHPDFQNGLLGNDRGAIQTFLDQDGKPQLISSTSIQSQQSFSQWFRDTRDVNVRLVRNLTLTETAVASGSFSYTSESFFPIDGDGWPPGYTSNANHNYHFTAEIQTSFNFAGSGSLTIGGNDDIWVFINGNLVIDLGGEHSYESSSVDFSQLGLTTGQSYPLAIFYAQRHMPNSSFSIITDINLTSTSVSIPTPGRSVSICAVKFPSFCGGNAPVSSKRYPSSWCPSDPAFRYLGPASTNGFENFNAIVFGNVETLGGIIEGRLAIGGNFTLTGNGLYNVGTELITVGTSATDNLQPYSFIVGKTAVFPLGNIFPTGDYQNFFSPPEYAFVGSNFSASEDLIERWTGTCSQEGCLDDDFMNARAFYVQLQQEFLASPINAQANLVNSSTLVITCLSTSTSTYILNLNVSTFNQITSYATPVNCNSKFQWVFNLIPDSESHVTVLSGNSFTFVGPESIVWNYLGYNLNFTAGVQPFYGSLLSPWNNLIQPDGIWMGLLFVSNIYGTLVIDRLTCPRDFLPPNPPPEENFCPFFESSCQGLILPLQNSTFSFRDYHVIVFGNFSGNYADIEGRLAVGGNALLNQYTIGYELGSDNNPPYSLIVGGNLRHLGGSIYPDGSGIPKLAPKSGIFVGGTVDVSTVDIARRVTGTCGNSAENSHCLDSYFEKAEECYLGYSLQLFSQAPNAYAQLIYGNGLNVTCQSISSSVYTFQVETSTLGAITWFNLKNCNAQAEWVINVLGTSDVTLQGQSFPSATPAVYNIPGQRNVNVINTSLRGHILAPKSTIRQSGSVIVGKVIAQEIVDAMQINVWTCQTLPPAKLLTY